MGDVVERRRQRDQQVDQLGMPECDTSRDQRAEAVTEQVDPGACLLRGPLDDAQDQV